MTLALWVYFILAALAANLPFMGERILGVVKSKEGIRKAFGWRLLELVLLYLCMVGVGLVLESRFAPIHTKKILDFYVPTFALFVIAAFPGLIACYFWRKPGM